MKEAKKWHPLGILTGLGIALATAPPRHSARSIDATPTIREYKHTKLT